MNVDDAHVAVNKAIEARDTRKAIQALEDCPECLREAPPCGGTWLHEAATAGMADFVLWLIKSNVNVNELDDLGNSAIYYASSYGHVPVINILASNNAVIDLTSVDSNLIFAAIEGGHTGAVRSLVNLGVDYRKSYTRGSMVNMDALGYAIERGQTEIADYLRSLGMTDPSGPTRRSTQPEHGSVLGFVESTVGKPRPLSLQQVLSTEPRVSIHVVETHDAQLLFTDGMSSRRMHVPAGQEEFAYAELTMMLPLNWPLTPASLQDPNYFWPLKWMLRLAHYPHAHNTWLGAPTTIISSAEPPKAFAANTKLSCLLALAGGFVLDRCELADGRKVVFYQLFPIYTEEREIERTKGVNHLLQCFKDYGIGPVVNVDRINISLLES